MTPFDRHAAQGLGHTPQPEGLASPAPAASPELAALKEGFRYGFALGFVVGLGVALLVVVAGAVLL